MDRVRTQARDMASASGGAGTQAQQRDQLRSQTQAMQQENERVMKSLNSDQSTAVQQRARSMQQIQDRINTRLQSMDRELAKPSPDSKRVAEQAQMVEREMAQYQTQYRAMGDDLSLRNAAAK